MRRPTTKQNPYTGRPELAQVEKNIYSVQTQKLMEEYNLDPIEISFARLLASGAKMSEAYSAIYSPYAVNEQNLTNAAKEIMKKYPNIKQCADDIKIKRFSSFKDDYTLEDEQRTAITNSQTTKPAKEYEDIFKDQETAIGEIVRMYHETENTDKKVDLLKKGVDLKKSDWVKENQQEDEKTLFYMPLTCYRCELYKKEQEQQKKMNPKHKDIL